MKEVLTAFGFKYIGTCGCKGPQTQIWQNPDVWRVDFNVTQTNFWLKKRSPIIHLDVTWGTAAQLEQKLIENGLQRIA